MSQQTIRLALDEKNPIWIKIYKFMVVFTAIAILVIGFIWGYDKATWSGEKHLDFLEFLLYLIIAIVAAFVEWVFGMVSVNFLNNVQIIREKMEEKKD